MVSKHQLTTRQGVATGYTPGTLRPNQPPSARLLRNAFESNERMRLRARLLTRVRAMWRTAFPGVQSQRSLSRSSQRGCLRAACHSSSLPHAHQLCTAQHRMPHLSCSCRIVSPAAAVHIHTHCFCARSTLRCSRLSRLRCRLRWRVHSRPLSGCYAPRHRSAHSLMCALWTRKL